MEKIKERDLVLILGKECNFLVEVGKNKKLHTDHGIIEFKDIIGKNYGTIIKTHLGKEFSIVRPTIIDFLSKKARMMPQAIRPKDAALILAFTGIDEKAKIVEAGTGSAWLTLFLASYCKKGKIYSYEIRKDFFKNAKKNVEASRLKNIILKNKDIKKGIEEKNVDLVVLDMIGAEEVIKEAFNVLKRGGWLIVYSPYIEQVKAVTEEIKKYNFTQITTLENIVRYWDVKNHTLPYRKGLMHTGFITLARKVF